MNKKIDLHIHSTFSDGMLTPKEICDEACKNEVSIISIADHDTIDAYTDELFLYAKKLKIDLIPGVEISAKDNEISVHVLGYNFDINNQRLKDELNLLRESRHIYLDQVVKKLSSLGYVVGIEKLRSIEAVSKAHIAHNIIDNNINKDLLIKDFGCIPTKGLFIETIMNEGGPAYVVKKSITPVMASKLIKEAGGKVVLAHPVCYKYEKSKDSQYVIGLLNEIKADGLEAIYLYVDKNDKEINDIVKWCELADELGLFITVGSDFHYSDGIRPEIGFKNKNIDKYMGENILNNIMN